MKISLRAWENILKEQGDTRLKLCVPLFAEDNNGGKRAQWKRTRGLRAFSPAVVPRGLWRLRFAGGSNAVITA